MGRIHNEQEHEKFNYDVDYNKQRHAAVSIRSTGRKVSQLKGGQWSIDGEVLSPRTLVERAERGHYAEENNEGRGKTEVELQPHKRRPDKIVAEWEGVRGNTNKRGDNKGRSSRNGSGGSEASRSGDSRLKVLARAEAKLVRKQRPRLSSVKNNNTADKAPVERKSKPRADRKRTKSPRQSASARPKTLRGKNRPRTSAKTRVRKRGS